MPKVYRLENAKGDGVFSAGVLSTATRQAELNKGKHTYPWHRPCPDEDGIGIRPSEICGFVSIAQYKKWFNGKLIRKALHENGIKLKVYEVPADHMRAGEWQCVFTKRAAVLVAERSCAI